MQTKKFSNMGTINLKNKQLSQYDNNQLRQQAI